MPWDQLKMKNSFRMNVFGPIKSLLRKDIKLFHSSPIYYREDAQKTIIRQMKTNRPFVLSRLGTTETEIILCFSQPKKFNISNDKRENINSLSGVFPTDNVSLGEFSDIYLNALREVDVLAVRSSAIERGFWEKEKYLLKNLPKLPVLLDIGSIDPMLFQYNWTQFLNKKKILIIHPFAKTIIHQLHRLDKIHKDTFVKFENCKFEILASVQSLGYQGGDDFDCWVSALNFMKDSIKRIDFDIALIGAGAYGLPLAHECKKMGRSAIHLGGSLQLLFGIRGKRWDDSGLYNEHWINPFPSDTPKGYLNVENGCYW